MRIKIIGVIALICVLSFGMYQTNVKVEASQEDSSIQYQQLSSPPMTIDESSLQYDALEYLKRKYSTSDWVKEKTNITSNVSNHIPIEMQGKLFPEEDILQAIENSPLELIMLLQSLNQVKNLIFR